MKKNPAISLVRTEKNHIDYILDDISPISKSDIENSKKLGYDFRADISNGAKCVTILIDGVPSAIIRTPNSKEVEVYVWAIFTNKVLKLRRQLHRESLRIVQLWIERYGSIVTTCRTGNSISLKWLKSLGFVEIGNTPSGDIILRTK